MPEPVTPLHNKRAVEFLIDTLMANEDVLLFPIGPLTNVALALRLEPRILDHIGEISLMGGSSNWGNATPAAEFNIWVDAEAADIVFRSGAKLTMCGLNLTRQAYVDAEVTARFRGLGTRCGRTMADLLDWQLASAGSFGRISVPLHDPCAVAAVVEPGTFEFEIAHVAVETRGEHTYGMTVVDQRYGTGPEAAERARLAGASPANCRVARTIDRARFFDLVCEALALP